MFYFLKKVKSNFTAWGKIDFYRFGQSFMQLNTHGYDSKLLLATITKFSKYNERKIFRNRTFLSELAKLCQINASLMLIKFTLPIFNPADFFC